MGSDSAVEAKAAAIMRSVPDIDSYKYRQSNESVLPYIVRTAKEGLELFASVPALREHSKKSMRFVLITAVALPPQQKLKVLRQIAEAFMGCQARLRKTTIPNPWPEPLNFTFGR